MPRRALAEVLIVYGVVAAATFAVTRFEHDARFGEYVPIAVAAFFLVTALRRAQREPDGMRRFGLDMSGMLAAPDDEPGGLGGLIRTLRRALPSALREIAFAGLVALIVFPPFAFGFLLWHGTTHPFALRLPADPPGFVASQLVLTALPEEAFFRGFVQTRLSDAFSRRTRVLGVELSLSALVLQAALFALVHFVVDFAPQRLAVFFPGLLFGWMRARRDGIGSALVFHAMCNTYSEVLARGWLG